MAKRNYPEFISSIAPETADIVDFLDIQFLSFPNIERKMRFNIPFYYQNSWVCYLNPIRKGKALLECVFISGKMLTNTHGLLESRGRKMVAGILLYDLASVPIEAILSSLTEALALDSQKGN